MWQAQQMGGNGPDELVIVECVDEGAVSYGQQFTLFNVFEYVVPVEPPTFDLRLVDFPPKGEEGKWFGLYATNKAGREYLNEDEEVVGQGWVRCGLVDEIPFYIYEIQQDGGIVYSNGQVVADLTEVEH